MNNCRKTFWKVFTPFNILFTYLSFSLICICYQAFLPFTGAICKQLLNDVTIICIPLMTAAIFMNIRINQRLHMFKPLFKLLSAVILAALFFSIFPVANLIFQLVTDNIRRLFLPLNRLDDLIIYFNDNNTMQTLILVITIVSLIMMIASLISILIILTVKNKKTLNNDQQIQKYKNKEINFSISKLNFGFLYKAIP